MLTGLLTFATSSKFDHVLASCTFAAIGRLANLKTERTCTSVNRLQSTQIEMYNRHSYLPHRRHSVVF